MFSGNYANNFLDMPGYGRFRIEEEAVSGCDIEIMRVFLFFLYISGLGFYIYRIEKRIITILRISNKFYSCKRSLNGYYLID